MVCKEQMVRKFCFVQRVCLWGRCPLRRYLLRKYAPTPTAGQCPATPRSAASFSYPTGKERQASSVELANDHSWLITHRSWPQSRQPDFWVMFNQYGYSFRPRCRKVQAYRLWLIACSCLRRTITISYKLKAVKQTTLHFHIHDR